MKFFKKMVSVLVPAAMVSVLAISISASALSSNSNTVYVSCTKKDTQSYSSSNGNIENYYDCGTILPTDNAYLKASASSSSQYIGAVIYYADYGSSNFKTETSTAISGGSVSKVYNPWDVDYLQPLSYAQSTLGSDVFYLRVTY